MKKLCGWLVVIALAMFILYAVAVLTYCVTQPEIKPVKVSCVDFVLKHDVGWSISHVEDFHGRPTIILDRAGLKIESAVVWEIYSNGTACIAENGKPVKWFLKDGTK